MHSPQRLQGDTENFNTSVCKAEDMGKRKDMNPDAHIHIEASSGRRACQISLGTTDHRDPSPLDRQSSTNTGSVRYPFWIFGCELMAHHLFSPRHPCLRDMVESNGRCLIYAQENVHVCIHASVYAHTHTHTNAPCIIITKDNQMVSIFFNL